MGNKKLSCSCYKVKDNYLDWWRKGLKDSMLTPNDEGIIVRADLEFYAQDLGISMQDLLSRLDPVDDFSFEWDSFTEEDLNTLNDEISGWDADNSETFGAIIVEVNGVSYIIDVCYDYWSWDDKHMSLDIFLPNEQGRHGKWIDSIHAIRSANSYKRFQSRAEKLIKEALLK